MCQHETLLLAHTTVQSQRAVTAYWLCVLIVIALAVCPSKQETTEQCPFNTGPLSTTLAQHLMHIGSWCVTSQAALLLWHDNKAQQSLVGLISGRGRVLGVVPHPQGPVNHRHLPPHTQSCLTIQPAFHHPNLPHFLSQAAQRRMIYKFGRLWRLIWWMRGVHGTILWWLVGSDCSRGNVWAYPPVLAQLGL